MLTSMSAAEQKWLIRILLKDMKFGLGQNRIFGAYHPDARELYDVSNNLLKVHNIYRVYCYLFRVLAFCGYRPYLVNLAIGTETVATCFFF
jgi:hypothetical protein